MVLAFWGFFLWGMNNPKVGNAVIAITIVSVALFIISLGRKFLWRIITNSEKYN
jgi:hypothetical protein